MTEEEIFHRQLINSFVKHVAKTPTEEFLIRSELIRRTRGFVGNMGPEAPQYANATTTIFFNRDRKAYQDNLAGAITENPHCVYTIETFPYGDTTLKSVSI